MAGYPESLLRRGGYNVAPVVLAIGTETARTAALASGLYEVQADAAAHFIAGAATVNAAVTSIPIAAWDTPRLLYVPPGATVHVAGIVAAGGTTGNLYLTRRV